MAMPCLTAAVGDVRDDASDLDPLWVGVDVAVDVSVEEVVVALVLEGAAELELLFSSFGFAPNWNVCKTVPF